MTIVTAIRTSPPPTTIASKMRDTSSTTSTPLATTVTFSRSPSATTSTTAYLD
jgi:hypothetical protein